MGRGRTGFRTQHVSFVGRWSLWSLPWPAWWQISWTGLLLARGPILAGSPEDWEQSMGPPSVMRLARLDTSHTQDTILVLLSPGPRGYFSASLIHLRDEALTCSCRRPAWVNSAPGPTCAWKQCKSELYICRNISLMLPIVAILMHYSTYKYIIFIHLYHTFSKQSSFSQFTVM